MPPLKTKTDLKILAHNMVLTARKIARLVTTEKFAIAFDKATDVDKAIMETNIRCSYADDLILAINRILVKHDCLDTLAYEVLRTMAKNEGIVRYSRLGKLALVKELKNVLGTTKNNT